MEAAERRKQMGTVQEARDNSVTHVVAHAYCLSELVNTLISQVDPFPLRFSR